MKRMEYICIPINSEKYWRTPNSYAREVCDFCGKMKNCDWWELQGYLAKPNVHIGYDLCRSCLKDFELGENTFNQH